MISWRDWWPWTKPGYITITRRQSNNKWRDGIAENPAPKNSECKNPLAKFSPRFFGPKTLSSSLRIFQKAKRSTPSITHLCCRRKVTKGVLFLYDSAPAHRALSTQKKLAYLGFQYLDNPFYTPDLAPSDYHLFPALKKTIERSPFFVRRGGHCCRWDLVGRTIFWIFLSDLQTLDQRAKKWNELRGEYVEKSRVWSLYLFSFLIGLMSYQHPPLMYVL